MSEYTVLGAGNGGQTLAALLKLAGHKVRLWNRSAPVLESLRQRGHIELRGQTQGKARIDLMTTDIAQAVSDVEIILVVVPASAHRDVALLIAPWVSRDQIIILNPGRTGGALEVRHVLTRERGHDIPTILETQSLFCACRARQPGTADILSFKRENTISGLPNLLTLDFLNSLHLSIYGDFRVAQSTLQTGLENIGAILHPAPVLLNTGWIESRDVFFPHYYFGISPSVSSFLERMDEERLAVADRFGVQVRSVKQWHEDMYGCVGSNLYETLQKNSAYASIDAPRTLSHRYLTEDIPTGLVPMSELGRVAGVPTPLMDMIIDLGCLMLSCDFRAEGRNLERMGISQMSVEEIKETFCGP